MTVRTYLVVIDDSAEARIALRFAARRAAKTAGAVALLGVVPPAEFVQWSGIQAAMEEEARLRVEAMVTAIGGHVLEEVGIQPEILVGQGDPVTAVQEALAERDDIAALVLGAAATNGPGPLVEHFAGPGVGKFACPVMIIPGALDEAALDRLS